MEACLTLWILKPSNANLNISEAWPRLSSMRRLLCSLRHLRRRSLAPPSLAPPALAWPPISAVLPSTPDPQSRLVPTWSSFSSLARGRFPPFTRDTHHCCCQNLTGTWVWDFSRGIGKAIALELGKRYFYPNRFQSTATQRESDTFENVLPCPASIWSHLLFQMQPIDSFLEFLQSLRTADAAPRFRFPIFIYLHNLMSRKANVVVNYARSKESAEAVAREIEGMGCKSMAIQVCMHACMQYLSSCHLLRWFHGSTAWRGFAGKVYAPVDLFPSLHSLSLPLLHLLQIPMFVTIAHESTALRTNDTLHHGWNGQKQCDTSDPAQVKEMFKTIDTSFDEPISCLINNAGILRGAPVIDMKFEDWKDVIDVNLAGVFLCSQVISGLPLSFSSRPFLCCRQWSCWYI